MEIFSQTCTKSVSHYIVCFHLFPFRNEFQLYMYVTNYGNAFPRDADQPSAMGDVKEILKAHIAKVMVPSEEGRQNYIKCGEAMYSTMVSIKLTD